jgi:hypothetical protein
VLLLFFELSAVASNGIFPRVTRLMHLEMFIIIMALRTIPVINVLFHAMKLRSQRPKRLAQSQLLKDVVLVVVVMDADMVMVMVAVGVTVPILRESGVPIRVILLLLVQIHLWVMESKSKMENG